MKQPPERQKLEETLRASKFAAGGFMGTDTRTLDDILESDSADLARAGYTPEVVAKRMRDITTKAQAGLGSWVTIDGNLEAMTTDTRGVLPCPWPHPGVFRKTVTAARRQDSGNEIRWSMLSIHLIEKHGFFQGIGSSFRLDPKTLTSIIF